MFKTIYIFYLIKNKLNKDMMNKLGKFPSLFFILIIYYKCRKERIKMEENLLKGKNINKEIRKRMGEEERRRIILRTEALDEAEKILTLLTLLKLNYENEFINLSILTPKELYEITQLKEQ